MKEDSILCTSTINLSISALRFLEAACSERGVATQASSAGCVKACEQLLLHPKPTVDLLLTVLKFLTALRQISPSCQRAEEMVNPILTALAAPCMCQSASSNTVRVLQVGLALALWGSSCVHAPPVFVQHQVRIARVGIVVCIT